MTLVFFYQNRRALRYPERNDTVVVDPDAFDKRWITFEERVAYHLSQLASDRGLELGERKLCIAQKETIALMLELRILVPDDRADEVEAHLQNGMSAIRPFPEAKIDLWILVIASTVKNIAQAVLFDRHRVKIKCGLGYG